VCGGTYVAEAGETLDSIAATCGTTVAAITAANPGLSGVLSAGQTLIVPGIAPTTPVTPVAPTPVEVIYPSATVVNNYYNTYNYYDTAPMTYYNPAPVNYNTGYSGGYNGTYIVQYGDTFSAIASRFGVSVYNLWAANPQVWDINLIYVGQAIRVPGSGVIAPTPKQELVPLSYGVVPPGSPTGKVKLSNQANGDVYVSLQGTTRDGATVINEYPVSGNMSVKIPAGWYDYVAWVGGLKFTGGFNLPEGADHSVTFYSNRVEVD
jgi:LysM repeat protein